MPRKAAPSAEHSDAQLGLGEIVRGRFHGPPDGPKGPGGGLGIDRLTGGEIGDEAASVIEDGSVTGVDYGVWVNTYEGNGSNGGNHEASRVFSVMTRLRSQAPQR